MTYLDEVRSYDHTGLAAAPAYVRVREALSDLANQAPPMDLPAFLAAVRDMAATTPYGDRCDSCDQAAGEWDGRLWWPHAATVEEGWLTGTYRCDHGHTWTCGYAVSFADYEAQAERPRQ